MKNKFALILLMCLFSINCIAQFSKTHYIPPISNSGSQSADEQYLYISCPSLTPINFAITQLGGAQIRGTVSRDAPYFLNIGFGSNTQLVIDESDINRIKNNKGYIIEADDLVYASIRVKAGGGFHAGSIVSKGLAALGTKFRIGAFVNVFSPNINANHYTFATILATENNTTISFGDIKPGVVMVDGTPEVGGSINNVVLNSGESYGIAVNGNSIADGLIGAFIQADKPIAVNCGSFSGNNGPTGNLDVGMDQIVSVERLVSGTNPVTGIEYSEYIFIKGNGVSVPETERPLIVANENNTEVFLDGSTTAVATLNAGQYLALNGNDFSANKNLYVKTSKKAFAYQGIAGTNSPANQNMHFLPPLSCQTPKSINNIPLINQVGTDTSFTGTVNIVTETGATLDFIINGANYTLTSLPAGVTISGPLTVTGNANFVTYILTGLTGNVSAFSSKQIYLSYFGSSGAATYGGFYSGFTFKPPVTFQPVLANVSNCIPNVKLSVSNLSGFDQFQWYFNGVSLGSTATASEYTPALPGYYKVNATLSACGISIFSDEFPVSDCPADDDNDGVNNNAEIDYDNDAISNCTESYGDRDLNILNTATGNLNVGTYSNTFTGVITTSTAASATPFIGNADGSFVSNVPAGKANWVDYQLTLANPMSVGIQYITTASPANLLNAAAEFVVKSPTNKTITVVNPSNQLLIDTNYDGFYESGITQFSSFDVRFRLNSAVPLAAGTGTFKFLTNNSSSISIRHKNLSDANPNSVSLKFYATCVPKDTDSDSIPDQLDLDSDNDGILDNRELMSQNFIAPSGLDINKNGMDDAYENPFITPSDKDGDTVVDYFDLDSDNDGIYDLVEAGSTAVDVNLDGVVDGNSASFGTNGLSNSVETVADNGILNYTLRNTDALLLNDYVDLDSDDDLCNDVVEAGFLDPNNDGLLGNIAPPTVNTKGVITGSGGYTIPNPDYVTISPINITTQPVNITTCELQGTATFTIVSSAVTGYQWQVSTDGGITFTNIINNAIYSNATTAVLSVANPTAAMSGYRYRVYLTRTGNTCGMYSSSAILTTWALPTLVPITTLKQCDNDTDGISVINLTEANRIISPTNFPVETFTYFTTEIAAQTNDPLFEITNPTTYTNTTATTQIWVRVENANGCYKICQLDVIVSATAINSNVYNRTFTVCDDFLNATDNDYDGISVFDFSPADAQIKAFLPPPISNYTVKYYKNLADAQAETNAIMNTTAYRNIGYPNSQDIFVRIDSNADNACYGMDKLIKLVVEKLPVFNTVGTNNLIRKCDDNNDGLLTVDFDNRNLESQILNGQTNKVFTYFDGVTNAPIVRSTIIPTFNVRNNTTVKVRVENTTSSTQALNGPCWTEQVINFQVDALPQNFANTIPSSLLVKCDDETTNPLTQNGSVSFDTSSFESTILGTQTTMELRYKDLAGNILFASNGFKIPNPYISGTQTIRAVVTNPVNRNCAIDLPISFVVNPLPRINLIGPEAVVCKNNPALRVVLNAGFVGSFIPTAYSYTWTYNNGTSTITLPQVSPTISVNSAGTYTVTVTTLAGCSLTRTIPVYASDIATIQSIDIEELTDINSVLVNVTGSGRYEFAIDDPTKYQTSNLFENVSIGFHTVYINDVYNAPNSSCGRISKEIAVLGAPRFFTPNGDGIQDYWNIKGTSKQFNYKTEIFIYNRFGTLIKQITPGAIGWDGTFNGTPALSDDYWYVIQLSDGRSAKGHFSLKR